jgi:endonuclease YncB( thermonuclease family)
VRKQFFVFVCVHQYCACLTRLIFVDKHRTNQADEPWAAEAKEYVRSRLIGKRVTVSIDYEREIPRGEQGGVARMFATVTYSKAKNNIAEQLIADGLATPVRHKQDEQKAADYDVSVLSFLLTCARFISFQTFSRSCGEFPVAARG